MQSVEEIQARWAKAHPTWLLGAIKLLAINGLLVAGGSLVFAVAAALYKRRDVTDLPAIVGQVVAFFGEIWPIYAVFVLGWTAWAYLPGYLRVRKSYREALKAAEQRQAYLDVKDAVPDGSLTEEPDEPAFPAGSFEAAKEAGVAAFREFIAANPMALAVVCAEHAFMRRHLTEQQDEQVILAAREHAFRHLTGRLSPKAAASFSHWITSVEAVIRKDIDLRCAQIDHALQQRAQHERAQHERAGGRLS